LRRALGALAVVAVLAAAGGAATALAGRVTFHEPESTDALARRLDEAVPRALAAHHVPGAAVAVVHDGRVAWARGYGVPADARFQVASLSKPVGALGILRLAREERFPLTDAVGWQPAATRFDARGITLARLLSHTAGLSVGGYGGLAPSAPLPSVTASLAGTTGDAPAVELLHPPGSRLEYSGGGYSVAQLWAEKASAQPFATLMRDTVLRPLGMTRSSFVQADLPGDAVPHDASGRAIPAYRYAELAAAGLRSTAPDMARFAAALMPGPHGEPPRVPAAMLHAAPATGGHWSLGLELAELGDGTRVVEHEGVSRGWRSRLVAYPDRGWAIVALTNGDGGPPSPTRRWRSSPASDAGRPRARPPRTRRSSSRPGGRAAGTSPTPPPARRRGCGASAGCSARRGPPSRRGPRGRRRPGASSASRA
jgi:CubicO group peptidase (beta-lactamase class C family)